MDGREIGPLPKVVKPRRRKLADASLLKFLGTYFPRTFRLAWSTDHLALIERLECCIARGGLFCLALPRGAGKTSIAVRTAIWAILTGRRRFVVLIGATERLAEKIVTAIRSELQTNDLLAEDYPEACHPIRKLENITKRQAGQTLGGEPTMIRLATEEIVLPTVAGSKSSGAVVRAVGLTGAVRGQMATLPGGETIRPDLVIPDDPQTRESAKSPAQTQDREDLINGDVLGLAGPGQAIACVMPCTVIYPDDLSDRFLDREKNPTWGGKRGKMLYAMPSDMALWDEYAELRRESFRTHADNRLGNAFYAERRAAMDAGAVSSWPERFNEDELSAVQNAMNFRIDKPRAFASDGQNEPERAELGDLTEIDAAAVLAKLNRVPRGVVPRECSRLTAFIDVGLSVCWWMACGWDDRFGGAVVDYGCWPRQNRSHFAASDARPSMAGAYPGVADEARIHAALADCTRAVLGREWFQQDTGTAVRVERCLIDSGYQADTVYGFCRRSEFAAVLLPSKGYAVTAARPPMSEWQRRPNERAGFNWRVGAPAAASGKLCTFDPNAWKSFIVERLRTPFGPPGCLSVFGADGHAHGLFVEHLTSEYRVRTEGRGRVVDAWQVRPDRTDNHWLDCLVGCAVGASERGVVWSASPEPVTPRGPRPKMKLSDLQAKKRQAH